MGKTEIVIPAKEHQNFFLRHICEDDLEDLRVWKNHYKDSFFLKTDITPKQQQTWYQNFKQRGWDFMFVGIEKSTGIRFGCMGFRILEEESIVDGYNIMRFRKTDDSSYTMSDVFQLMLDYIKERYEMPIQVKVLKTNKAKDWYIVNGFEKVEEHNDFVILEFKSNG